MRQQRQQNIHDMVIAIVADKLEAKHGSTQVRTNPGSQKNHEVDGHWPDIVFVDGSGVTQTVYEVETTDTVTLSHAKEQWNDYDELGVPFYLVIPEICESEAKRIIRELGVCIEQLILY